MGDHDELTPHVSIKLIEVTDPSQAADPSTDTRIAADKTGTTKTSGCMDCMLGCLLALSHEPTKAEGYVWKLSHDNLDHSTTLKDDQEESNVQDLTFWRRRK